MNVVDPNQSDRRFDASAPSRGTSFGAAQPSMFYSNARYEHSPEYVTATVWERIGAALLDRLIIYAITLVMMGIVVGLVVLFGGFYWLGERLGELSVYDDGYYGDATNAFMALALMLPIYGMALIAGIPSFVYFLLKDGMKDGQSIGKRVLGLYTYSYGHGTPIQYGKSALRNIILTLMSCVPFGELAMVIMMGVREDGRHLGDLAADTVVVKRNPNRIR